MQQEWWGSVAGTSFNLSAEQQAEGAKDLVFTTIACQVRVHCSIFPPFSTKGDVWRSDQTSLHPSNTAESECADSNTLSSLSGDFVKRFVIKILHLNCVWSSVFPYLSKDILPRYTVDSNTFANFCHLAFRSASSRLWYLNKGSGIIKICYSEIKVSSV